MILGQALAQKFKTLFRRVHDLEKLQILWRNSSRIHHGLEVDQAVPVLAAVDHDENFLGQLLRLREGEYFEELIHGSEASGKNHQRFRQICEPKLAHEEVVKFEIQRGG